MSQTSPKPGPPLWLRAAHCFERAIGGPVEAVVRSDTYFDLVAEATRARARLGGTLEALSRRSLHLLNLPAGSDIRRLREQFSRMERRLAEITKDLDRPEPLLAGRPDVYAG
jgi:hypothetical protein